jgi:hypothetical protein
VHDHASFEPVLGAVLGHVARVAVRESNALPAIARHHAPARGARGEVDGDAARTSAPDHESAGAERLAIAGRDQHLMTRVPGVGLDTESHARPRPPVRRHQTLIRLGDRDRRRFAADRDVGREHVVDHGLGIPERLRY